MPCKLFDYFDLFFLVDMRVSVSEFHLSCTPGRLCEQIGCFCMFVCLFGSSQNNFGAFLCHRVQLLFGNLMKIRPKIALAGKSLFDCCCCTLRTEHISLISDGACVSVFVTSL